MSFCRPQPLKLLTFSTNLKLDMHTFPPTVTSMPLNTKRISNVGMLTCRALVRDPPPARPTAEYAYISCLLYRGITSTLPTPYYANNKNKNNNSWP